MGNPTQLLVINEPGIPDMVRSPTFFIWFENFKKNAIFKLYSGPLIDEILETNRKILMNEQLPVLVAESE